MKNLAQKFLTDDEYRQIDETVKAAERLTSGEIVCMVQSASYHYPMSDVIGASAFALPLALAFTPVVGGMLWIGTQSMWIFLTNFIVLFALFHWIVRHAPKLKRLFISAREIAEEVEEAAVTSFFHHGLYRTKDGTGILIFISVFEHKVWVLADQGINEKMAEGQWESIVARITQGIKAGTAAQAICDAIGNMGKMLQTHFPVQQDDVDELANVIVRKK